MKTLEEIKKTREKEITFKTGTRSYNEIVKIIKSIRELEEINKPAPQNDNVRIL